MTLLSMRAGSWPKWPDITDPPWLFLWKQKISRLVWIEKAKKGEIFLTEYAQDCTTLLLKQEMLVKVRPSNECYGAQVTSFSYSLLTWQVMLWISICLWQTSAYSNTYWKHWIQYNCDRNAAGIVTSINKLGNVDKVPDGPGANKN